MNLLKSKITKKILSLYPLYYTTDLIDEAFEKKYYKNFTISPFDHWLSKEEAKDNIVFFSKKMTRAQKEKYNLYESRYINTFKSLFQKHEIFAFVEGKYSEELYSCDDINKFQEFCLKSIREEELLKLLIPNLGIIIEGGYDLSNHVFYKKNNDNSIINEFKNLFIKNNFFLLY